jgi:cyclase
MRARIVPVLLLSEGGLVKTVRFQKPRYVGDPINAVRIFNDKEVDEIAFLDIGASRSGSEPNYTLLADIATEAFMPFGYGGGVRTLDQIKRLFALGVEKVILNSVLADDPELVTRAADAAGSQSVVVSMDCRNSWLGRTSVWTHGGTRSLHRNPVEYAKEMERRGAGEILIHSIDRDGMMQGYDLEAIGEIASAVSVPVIAAGGAGSLDDLRSAIRAGASAAAAGSLFVFHGRHRAVLISYPSPEELESAIQ